MRGFDLSWLMITFQLLLAQAFLLLSQILPPKLEAPFLLQFLAQLQAMTATYYLEFDTLAVQFSTQLEDSFLLIDLQQIESTEIF
jgi:hypothetical protein